MDYSSVGMQNIAKHESYKISNEIKSDLSKAEKSSKGKKFNNVLAKRKIVNTPQFQAKKIHKEQNGTNIALRRCAPSMV